MAGIIGKGRLRVVFLYASSALGIVLLAWWLGAALGRHRAASIASQKRQELRSYLDEHLRSELSVGRAFPGIVLSFPDGRRSCQIRNVLRHGGLVVYLSAECPVCMEIVDSVGVLISRNLLDDSTTVILTSGSPAALANYMLSRHIVIPILRDSSESLSRDFGVMTQPCFFFLDSAGMITWYDTGEYGLSGFVRVRERLLASDDRGTERR